MAKVVIINLEYGYNLFSIGINSMLYYYSRDLKMYHKENPKLVILNIKIP